MITTQGISTAQVQSYSVSQETIMSCNILAMGTEELTDYINEAVLENPMIEIENHTSADAINIEVSTGRLPATSGVGDELVGGQAEIPCDINGRIPYSYSRLRNYLKIQIPDRNFSATDRKIAIYIIESIDESGYFRGAVEYIAELFRVKPEHVLDILSLIQHMDPPGIGARNLRECLLLQLDTVFPHEVLAKEIVCNYLELLAKNQLKVISQKSKHGIDEVSAACSIIRELNPKPGSDYSSAPTSYIYPDIMVSKTEAGFKIELTRFSLPNIDINDQYYPILRNCPDESTKNYILDRYKQANLIKSCIKSRQETLLMVSRQIFEAQKLFFYRGPKYLVPLKQKDIADMLELHESTICRAVKDKYLRCSWGIFELKYFFSNKLCPSETEYGASNAKELICEIISKEDAAHPYSDQQISDKLSLLKISASRRTVAKYREEAGISNSALRKRY